MAVPAGDERDFEFANEFNLPIIEVVSPDGNLHGNDQCFKEYGISVNSDEYSGGTRSGRSERSWPSLTKVGPSLSNARLILMACRCVSFIGSEGRSRFVKGRWCLSFACEM